MNKKQFDISIAVGSAILLGAIAYLSASTGPELVEVSTTVKSHLHYDAITRDDTVGTVLIAPEQWNIVTREGYMCEVSQYEYNSLRVGDSVVVDVEEIATSIKPMCHNVN